jgi:hypothetical protein
MSDLEKLNVSVLCGQRVQVLFYCGSPPLGKICKGATRGRLANYPRSPRKLREAGQVLAFDLVTKCHTPTVAF